MGNGHSFVGAIYSRRFRMNSELSEGSSRFVDLKEEVHDIQHVTNSRWRKVPTYHWKLHEVVDV